MSTRKSQKYINLDDEAHQISGVTRLGKRKRKQVREPYTTTKKHKSETQSHFFLFFFSFLFVLCVVLTCLFPEHPIVIFAKMFIKETMISIGKFLKGPALNYAKYYKEEARKHFYETKQYVLTIDWNATYAKLPSLKSLVRG